MRARSQAGAVPGEWNRAMEWARACGAMGERRTGVDIVAMRLLCA